MSDGYEYWFTEWNLEENRWEMNLLTGTDISVDSDDDSYDCNGDGIISPSETFDNLAEFESRIYGKKLAIDSIPNGTGLVSYGADTINAFMDEQSMSYSLALSQLYVTFSTKSISSTSTTNNLPLLYVETQASYLSFKRLRYSILIEFSYSLPLLWILCTKLGILLLK